LPGCLKTCLYAPFCYYLPIICLLS